MRLIVSTPASGWFSCGGERGPGIALLLMLGRALPELAASLRAQEAEERRLGAVGSTRIESNTHADGSARPAVHSAALSAVPAVEVLLLANTLHELGHAGAESSSQLAPQLGFTPSATAAWLALGASIITFKTFPTDGTPPSGTFTANLDYSDRALADALFPYEAAGFSPVLNPPDRRGELLEIIRAGYTAFGFYGEHELFHTRADHANSTSPELLEQAAAPTLMAVETILRDALAQSRDAAAAAVKVDAVLPAALPPSVGIMPVLLAVTAVLAAVARALLAPRQTQRCRVRAAMV